MAKKISKFRYNGISYTEIKYEDGRVEHDPPLPEGLLEKWAGNFAEIVRTRKGPGLKTENNFFAGRGTLAEQFKDDPGFLERIVSRARAKGFEPNPNSVYFESVANDDGDPDAFVTQAEGLGKLRKVCEKRGLYCEELGTQKFDVAPSQNVRLAEDLVQEQMAKYRQTPEHEKTSDAELREFVIETHGAKG